MYFLNVKNMEFNMYNELRNYCYSFISKQQPPDVANQQQKTPPKKENSTQKKIIAISLLILGGLAVCAGLKFSMAESEDSSNLSKQKFDGKDQRQMEIQNASDNLIKQKIDEAKDQWRVEIQKASENEDKTRRVISDFLSKQYNVENLYYLPKYKVQDFTYNPGLQEAYDDMASIFKFMNSSVRVQNKDFSITQNKAAIRCADLRLEEKLFNISCADSLKMGSDIATNSSVEFQAKFKDVYQRCVNQSSDIERCEECIKGLPVVIESTCSNKFLDGEFFYKLIKSFVESNKELSSSIADGCGYTSCQKIVNKESVLNFKNLYKKFNAGLSQKRIEAEKEMSEIFGIDHGLIPE